MERMKQGVFLSFLPGHAVETFHPVIYVTREPGSNIIAAFVLLAKFGTRGSQIRMLLTQNERNCGNQRASRGLHPWANPVT